MRNIPLGMKTKLLLIIELVEFRIRRSLNIVNGTFRVNDCLASRPWRYTFDALSQSLLNLL